VKSLRTYRLARPKEQRISHRVLADVIPNSQQLPACRNDDAPEEILCVFVIRPA
jgi:hypothetical protein